MSDWRPIETAPKDGSWIVLLIPESCQDSSRPRPWVETARWVDEKREVWELVSPMLKELKIDDASHWSCYEDPAYWQPLPFASTVKSGGLA